MVSFVSLISMKQRLSIFLGVLFLGLNNPEAKTAGCRFSVDPLTQVNVSITPYVYCANNPVNFIDPDGRNFTHYADRNYNILLQTNDGSNNVVMVPDEKIRDFKFFGNSYGKHSGMRTYYDSPGWNMHWVEEFGLAPRQLSEGEVSVLSLYHGNKAQNAAVGFMLKPTAGNIFKTAGLEVLAQWRTPELLAGGVSIGISALSSLSALQAAKGAPKLLNQFNSAESLIQGAGNLTKVKAGMQGFVKGDGPSIFKAITNDGTLQSNGQYLMKNGMQIGNHLSRTTGVYTIHITPTVGKMVKIRITP